MENITLKQLRALSAVVRTKSVTHAAAELHVTPPAITTQMRILEEEVGMKLLDRSGKTFRLTEAGVELLAANSRIIAALSECSSAIAALRDGARGSITVGVVSTAKYFAPKAIAAFAQVNSDVDVKLLVGNRQETIQALDDYKVDCAIMGRPPEEEGITRTIIGDHPHIIIAHPDHHLKEASDIPLSRLLSENILIREYGSGTRLLFETILSEQGIGINDNTFGMEISSNETIKQSVMAGMGIAFISAHAVSRELNDNLLIALNVAGLPRMRKWYVVRQHDKRMMPAAIRFYEFMLNHGKEYLPEISEFNGCDAGNG